MCESGISASFPIMAAALLPGPSSPLLFFGKRELWRQKQRREGLTQRRPHTTAAGWFSAASSPNCLCGARYSTVIDFSAFSPYLKSINKLCVPYSPESSHLLLKRSPGQSSLQVSGLCFHWVKPSRPEA